MVNFSQTHHFCRFTIPPFVILLKFPPALWRFFVIFAISVMIASIQRPLLSCNWNIFQTQDEFCQIHHFCQLLHFVRNAFCNLTQVFAIRLLGNERFCHTRSRGKSSLLCQPVNLIRIGANDVTNSDFGYFDVAVNSWYRQGLHGFNLSWIEFLRCHLTLNLSF